MRGWYLTEVYRGITSPFGRVVWGMTSRIDEKHGAERASRSFWGWLGRKSPAWLMFKWRYLERTGRNWTGRCGHCHQRQDKLYRYWHDGKATWLCEDCQPSNPMPTFSDWPVRLQKFHDLCVRYRPTKWQYAEIFPEYRPQLETIWIDREWRMLLGDTVVDEGKGAMVEMYWKIRAVFRPDESKLPRKIGDEIYSGAMQWEYKDATR